jgi:murein DD-endopeptidase MepM/ murein hydrolase activator NlpD
MRHWPRAAQVVPGLKDMLKRKFALAAKGIGGWMYGTRDMGSGPTHHNGIDLPCSVGMGVFAMWDGEVMSVSSDPISGVYVILEHDSPCARVSYCHLSRTLVVVGARVKAGELVGATGESGRCQGAHLHLTLRTRGADGGEVDVDPMYVLRESCWL